MRTLVVGEEGRTAFLETLGGVRLQDREDGVRSVPQRASGIDHFRNTIVWFEQTMQWLREETGSATHSEMERALGGRGFELMRVMHQEWLDQRSFEERRRGTKP